jgi:hypothetical protein
VSKEALYARYVEARDGRFPPRREGISEARARWAEYAGAPKGWGGPVDEDATRLLQQRIRRFGVVQAIRMRGERG